jgi:hypothetical protein
MKPDFVFRMVLTAIAGATAVPSFDETSPSVNNYFEIIGNYDNF